MDILEIFNPWWKEKSISKELALPYRRKAFLKLKKMLNIRQVIILTGLRRVGKSTLMYQLIEELLKNTNPLNILYYSFDEKTGQIIDILNDYSEITGINWKKEKCFLFLDEIQKLHDWSNKIKILYDSFPNLKIILSGSSSFELEKEAKKNLMGRHFIVFIQPLSFVEYLELKSTLKRNNSKKSMIDLKKKVLWEREIKREFKNYLFRPFPELVNIKDLGLIKTMLKDSVIEKIIKVDLPIKFDDLSKDLLSRIIDMVYSTPGIYINYDQISRDWRVSKKSLIKHFYYLEFAYLLRRVRNYRPGMRSVSRKLQRAYPYHWSLEFGWNGSIDYETIIASILNTEYYWREKGKEVDFLILNKKILPIEVKESKKVNISKIKPLIYFMNKYNVKKGFLIYDGVEEKITINGKIIHKLPLWKIVVEPITH